MSNAENILISLAPRHAQNIFDGVKHIELRRRPMNLAPGTLAWIYVTLPVGALVGRATVSAVHSASPMTLWRKFGSVSGLERNEFLSYLEGIEKGVVLVLEDVKRLQVPLQLVDLRELSEGFNPPQFFIRIGKAHPLFNALLSTRFSRRSGQRNFGALASGSRT